MRTKADMGETDTAATKQAKLNRGRAVLSTRQMIFDVIGDLFTHRCQLKQLVFDNWIVGLLGKLPILGRFVP
jgi:hypothetical protein